ncbi:MAG: DUF4062 domain-containing protein [Syntrophales bacterium]|nr:DUF4062 domain-containing protein [Syntrophales bacterium]
MSKTVFLSSVFRSLTHVRQAVHDRLIELGYKVWWAENRPELATPEAKDDVIAAVCLQGIETSDIYLGVFPARYGSDPLDLAFTELEYHHAVSRGLPRFLYIVDDRRFVTIDQEMKQTAFLHLIRDRELSTVRPKRVGSASELISQISTDFSELHSHPLITSEPWQAPSLKRIGFSIADIIVPRELPDLSPLSAAALLQVTADDSFPEATVSGLVFLRRFFSNPDWGDRSFLKDLDEFLAAWTYVSAWAGVRGPLGQTSISKSRIVLSQMIGDYWSSASSLKVYDLAGAVASGLYSEGRLPAARKWYELSRRSKPLPWLAGAIELAEGDVAKAKDHFKDMLINPVSADVSALYLSQYGRCLVREGLRREGMAHLDESAKIENIQTTTSVRIYRSISEAYLHFRELDTALVFIERAISIARASGLRDQWRKAVAQRRLIMSNDKMQRTRYRGR